MRGGRRRATRGAGCLKWQDSRVVSEGGEQWSVVLEQRQDGAESLSLLLPRLLGRVGGGLQDPFYVLNKMHSTPLLRA